MKFKVIFFVVLFLILKISSAQDIPAPNPDEFTEAQPSSTSPPPPTVSSTTEPSREPEETTPSVSNKSAGCEPECNMRLFKWVQYRQIRNGKCFTCGCLQYKHYRDTCECFNNYIHAKANLFRGMYIKRSPWYPCHPGEGS